MSFLQPPWEIVSSPLICCWRTWGSETGRQLAKILRLLNGAGRRTQLSGSTALLTEGGMAHTVPHSGKGNDFPRGAPHFPCTERLMASLPCQLSLSLARNPWAVWCLLGDRTFLATPLMIMVTTIISKVLTTCQVRCQVLGGMLS